MTMRISIMIDCQSRIVNCVSPGNTDIRCRTWRCGFTVAELLLVVMIIALVAGVSGGLYVGTHKRLLVEKAARDLLLTAKYARIMAIEQQHPYEIQLDVVNRGFWLTTSQWDEETGRTEPIVVRDYYCKPVQLEGDVQFEDIQVVPVGTETATEDEQEQTIIFSPTGTAQTAVVQLGDGRSHYTVSISAATGKAKVYFGMVEGVEVGTIDLDAE